MFSLRLLNISRSGALNQAVLLIKNRSVPWGLTEGGGRSRGARSDKQKRRARSADASMPEGGTHFEATNVRDTAFSYSCAGVRCHSCSPGRPKRPTGRPRAEPTCNRYEYNRCARFNDPASKTEPCGDNHACREHRTRP